MSSPTQQLDCCRGWSISSINAQGSVLRIGSWKETTHWPVRLRLTRRALDSRLICGCGRRATEAGRRRGRATRRGRGGGGVELEKEPQKQRRMEAILVVVVMVMVVGVVR